MALLAAVVANDTSADGYPAAYLVGGLISLLAASVAFSGLRDRASTQPPRSRACGSAAATSRWTD